MRNALTLAAACLAVALSAGTAVAERYKDINRALLGCWAKTLYDEVPDDRETSREFVLYREWCFRDDGVVVVTSMSSCGQVNARDYVLRGNALTIFDGWRSTTAFRIARLGTELRVQAANGATNVMLRYCREVDGEERCPHMFAEPRP